MHIQLYFKMTTETIGLGFLKTFSIPCVKTQFVVNISHVICHQKLTRLVVGDKIKAVT